MGILATVDLEQQITSLGIRTTLIASALLIVLTIAAALLKDRVPKLKLPLFLLMAFTMIGTTVVLFGSTIYLNMKAESGGPVHWHTDIEFWACGTELELRDPHGLLSNKIGTSTYHEHNDKRIHLEGVVVKKSEDASLEKFMRVTDGYISPNGIGIPLNDSSDEWFVSGESIDGDKQDPGKFPLANKTNEWIIDGADGPVVNLVNGKSCPGTDEPAEVQAFVYRFNEKDDTYIQEKLAEPGKYIMRDESLVPPGDCVIVEFDAPKNTTDKLCQQYGVRDAERCIEFGVKEYSSELCNIHEVGREI